VRELFVAGTEPVAHERYYTRGADGALAIDPPTEARAWAHDARLLLGGTAGAPAADRIRIVTPATGSVFWLAPELAAQQLVLRAAVEPGVDRLTFAVDGTTVGYASAADPGFTWTLEPGRHTLLVSAAFEGGDTVVASSTFEVRR
jgi:hypothetical protein